MDLIRIISSAFALSGALLVLPVSAIAQRFGVAPGVGTGVRFRIVDGSSESTRPASYRCEGTVSGVTGDTILITADRNCVVNSSVGMKVADLYVERGDRGSRLRHFVYGALLGAITGGVIGRVVAGDGCRVTGCDDAGLAIGVITTAGVAAGAIAGGGVGLALPAGRQWQPWPGVPFAVAPAGVTILRF